MCYSNHLKQIQPTKVQCSVHVETTLEQTVLFLCCHSLKAGGAQRSMGLVWICLSFWMPEVHSLQSEKRGSPVQACTCLSTALRFLRVISREDAFLVRAQLA